MNYTQPYTRTSNDYRPCVMLTPDGDQRKANVYYIRLMDPTAAADALKQGKIAFVAPDDAPAVGALLNRTPCADTVGRDAISPALS